MKLASYKARGRESFGAVWRGAARAWSTSRRGSAPRFTSVLDLLRARRPRHRARGGARRARRFSARARWNSCRRCSRRRKSSASASTTPTATPITATQEVPKYPSMFYRAPGSLVGHGQHDRAAARIRAARLRRRDRAGDRPGRPPHRAGATRSIMSPASRCATRAPSATGCGTASSTSRRARTGTPPAASARGS